MEHFGITDKSYQLIVNTLRSFPEVEKSYIFGSRAKGNARRGSDIDLALFGSKVDYKIVSKISSILNEDLPIPYKVDVLGYHLLKNEELKTEVDKHGLLFI
jgi:predicted nucleotidyltransferase